MLFRIHVFRVQVFQSPCFSDYRFFRVQVFQGPGFSGSRFFKVQVFQGTDFSGSRLFRVQVFQGPGFSGSRFFRFRVQGPGPGFRSSLTPENLSNFERFFFPENDVLERANYFFYTNKFTSVL